jgi:hypothetical protein
MIPVTGVKEGCDSCCGLGYAALVLVHRAPSVPNVNSPAFRVPASDSLAGLSGTSFSPLFVSNHSC